MGMGCQGVFHKLCWPPGLRLRIAHSPLTSVPLGLLSTCCQALAIEREGGRTGLGRPDSGVPR